MLGAQSREASQSADRLADWVPQSLGQTPTWTHPIGRLVREDEVTVEAAGPGCQAEKGTQAAESKRHRCEASMVEDI